MAFNEQSSPQQQPTRNPRDRVRQPTGDPSNPYGIGDPNDQSLRKVEIEIQIPMKMRDRAKEEKCTDVVKAFSECCKDAGVAMVIKCRKQNSELKACLGKWYTDEDFKKECTEQYLKERTDYRRTGIKKKDMQRYVV